MRALLATSVLVPAAMAVLPDNLVVSHPTVFAGPRLLITKETKR
jgi:hypothetical protein